jgi:hypothetical protein
VWIADERFDDGSSSQTDNLITAAQAAAMAAKFDSIYGYETALFGFEYGGKTDGIYTGQPSGGVDRDLRVQILVYDIDYDAAVDKKSFVVGYFWAKDLENGAHSNQAEMFYIDSEATDKNPELAYSTLVHEFQHMINYNRKFILSNEMRASSTWFDEMLSMLAEDMISPLIGINANNSAHPIKGRIPAFIGYYDRGGITGWNTAEPLISYAVSYGFGAYLARNYGGPSLIKAIMDANEVDIAAINNALNNTPGGISGSSPFQDALQRYGEALIFSGGFMPSGANSFDKDKAGNADTSNTYTFKGFDIWDTANPATGYPGPTVWSLDWQFPMPAYSIIVQSLADWQGVQGNLNITVTKPHNPANVKLYLMVR